jgi:hypothetical protein
VEVSSTVQMFGSCSCTADNLESDRHLFTLDQILVKIKRVKGHGVRAQRGLQQVALVRILTLYQWPITALIGLRASQKT